ncbi:MAG: ABC transporter substrate-binding protein [Candidatus Elarobacter sp.]
MLVPLMLAVSGMFPAGAADPIKIGVNLELSGPSSTWGTPQLNSIQMYVDEANAKGGIGGRKIELEVLDNKSDPSQSKLNVTKLVNDGVVAIIGGGTTPTTMPAIPVAEGQGVPMISNGAANVITTPVDQRKWIFKTPNEDGQVAERVVGFLNKEKAATVAFMSVNTAYGDSGKNSFTPAAQRANIKIAAEEKFAPNDTDMTPQLTKIRDAKVDAVVVWGNPPATTIVAKNAAQLGLKAKLIFSTGAGGASFVGAGKDVAGAFLVTTKITVVDALARKDPQRGILEIYISEYKNRFHSDPDVIAAYGADGIRLLLSALRTGGTDRGGVRAGLEKISNYPSYSGRYTFSSHQHMGLSTSDLVVAQSTGGGWKIVEH